MEKALWDKIESIVDEALTLSGEDRDTFVEEHCKGNEVLRGHVTQLLNEIQEAEDSLFLEEKSEDYRKIAESTPLRQSEYVQGDHVGPYEIESIIASGGMGSVYKAKRADGAFEMDVAIKFIKTQNYTRETLRRFELERQILAKLQHTNIARMLDGGVTEDGVPYIILEFVNGTPIDEYCKMHNCSINQRISLFKQVLEGVRYAHENLVIHRDLKPGNILVDESGKVKILDFGISKLLGDEDDATLTQTGIRLLTPRYAAPEQIRQEPITTATDLYALGIIFYELLSGVSPFHLDDATRYEIEQAVISQEPKRPSQKVDDASEKKRIEGDLDAIALKAIRKEPELRYRVANEFLEDLNHYQKNLPISAREGSLKYRGQKFMGRHKKAIALVAVFVISLIALATFYTLRLEAERDLAQLEAGKATEITNFLKDLFNANDPNYAPGQTITAKNLLDEGAKKIQEMNERPELKAEMFTTIGYLYTNLGEYENAEPLFAEAIRLLNEVHGESHPEVYKTMHAFGMYYVETGNLEKASTLISEAYEGYTKTETKPDIETVIMINNLGLIYHRLGEYHKAREFYLKALDVIPDVKEAHVQHTRILNNLGFVTEHLGDLKTAKTYYWQALDLKIKLLGERNSSVAIGLNNLGRVLLKEGELDSAGYYHNKALELRKDLYGGDHQYVAQSLNNIANVHFKKNNFEQAERNFVLALEIYRESLGDSSQFVGLGLGNLGNVYLNGYKDLEKAHRFLSESIAIYEKVLGKEHPKLIRQHELLSDCFNAQGNIKQAAKHLKQALAIQQKTLSHQTEVIEAFERKIQELNQTALTGDS